MSAGRRAALPTSTAPVAPGWHRVPRAQRYADFPSHLFLDTGSGSQEKLRDKWVDYRLGDEELKVDLE